jgi:hypothetical protein
MWLRHGAPRGSGRSRGGSVSLELTRAEPAAASLPFTLSISNGRMAGEAAEDGKRYRLQASRIPS